MAAAAAAAATSPAAAAAAAAAAVAAAAVARAHPSAAAVSLPGDPQLPFHRRLNLLHARGAGLIGELLLLAMHMAFVRRIGMLGLSTAALAWQASTLCLLLTSIAWRVLAPRSHLRWREVLAAALRLTSLGLGVGISQVWQLVNASAPGGDAAATEPGWGAWGGFDLGHAARLLFASCAISLYASHCTLRTRPSLSALAQLGLVASLLPHTRAGCNGAALAHAGARRATRVIYSAMSWIGTPLPLPLAPFAQPDAAAECATIVTWLQVAAGLLLPLLFEWLAAAHAFALHQRQRAAASLPRERGLHAWLYGVIYDLCGDGELAMGPSIPPLVLAWLLLAVSWDWCCFFIGRPASAA